ncbi:prepilin peptidase [Klenkia brasiliensis]|uniref:Leader peptidase (Prepilin peptidase) / N-methyltransferase n=1 Tax=Klenkia brasiliensis TaxID=333142 RepID=A0A1G7V092_9ACTN|nr:A24 family peptidase [Klenkia brasiliensis]SDG52921.1 leader peptidase (prepilin peptidase) / N-methyltransferase [Klenkia brasiliensis]
MDVHVWLGLGGALVGLPLGHALNRAAQQVVARRPDAADLLPGDLLTRPTAVRPPWVELGTAALLAAVAVAVGPSPLLPAWLWLAGWAVLLTVVDLQHKLLPNRALLPATGGAVVLLAGTAVVTGDGAALLRALVSAVALGAVLYVLAFLTPNGLGLGDVKLGPLLGLYLGWVGVAALALGVFLGFVVQALVALVLLAARRATKDTQLPFGPALLAGALVAGLLLLG